MLPPSSFQPARCHFTFHLSILNIHIFTHPPIRIFIFTTYATYRHIYLYHATIKSYMYNWDYHGIFENRVIGIESLFLWANIF